jgi:hypothetical protein
VGGDGSHLGPHDQNFRAKCDGIASIRPQPNFETQRRIIVSVHRAGIYESAVSYTLVQGGLFRREAILNKRVFGMGR